MIFPPFNYDRNQLFRSSGSPEGQYVAQFGSGSFGQLDVGRAEIEEAGYPFRSRTEQVAHILIIGRPAGDPAADKSERMGGVKNVHGKGAAAELLFPERNFCRFDRG